MRMVIMHRSKSFSKAVIRTVTVVAEKKSTIAGSGCVFLLDEEERSKGKLVLLTLCRL